MRLWAAATPFTVTVPTVRPSKSNENCESGAPVVVAVMVAVAASMLLVSGVIPSPEPVQASSMS